MQSTPHLAARSRAPVKQLSTLAHYRRRMGMKLTSVLDALLKIGAVALVLNEVRGLILAVPVLWAMYESGGSLMAIWLGISTLGGIALSVIVPLFAAKKVKAYAERRLAPASA